jgi:hypothetical protein
VPPALKGVQKLLHGDQVRRAEGLQFAGCERLDKTFIVPDTSPIVRFYADDFGVSCGLGHLRQPSTLPLPRLRFEPLQVAGAGASSLGSSAAGLPPASLAQGSIEAKARGFGHDGIHDGPHRLADLVHHRLDLAFMREGRRHGLPQRVEPGINVRLALLVTGCGQVHLKRRLVHEPVDAQVDINACAGRCQAMEAPSQLSHTPSCCCASNLLRSGPSDHRLTGLPCFLQ